jgi:hypothetical protein
MELVDNHAYHHAYPGHPDSAGAVHFGNVARFIQCQIKHKYLMLDVDSYQLNPMLAWLCGSTRTMHHMAWAMLTKDYTTIRSFVAFRDVETVAGIDEQLVVAYKEFQRSITINDIKSRLEAIDNCNHVTQQYMDHDTPEEAQAWHGAGGQRKFKCASLRHSLTN